MSGRLRIIVIVVVLLAVAVLSRLFLYSGDPHVEVAPEVLFSIGGFNVTNSLFTALLVDIILVTIAFLATRNMQLVPRGLQNVMEAILEALYGVLKNISPRYINVAWPLVATIFLFVLTSNWLGLIPSATSVGVCHHSEEASARLAFVREGPQAGSLQLMPAAAAEGGAYTSCGEGYTLIPWLRPPSTDLNFTLALGLLSFVFFEYWGFRALGLGYLKKFFNLNGIMSFVGIIEFISEIIKPIALALRLFGNIFAGEVLIAVLTFMVPLILPMPIYAFELFVGFIQALVFALLTMAFLSIATTSHEGEHHGKDEEQSFDPAYTKTPPEVEAANARGH
ncbi:MAG TPA: F0F1 ATP synthase subunit A [Chloroflexaceae bacterium]|nr:F0F1 ATP synthase subunit A [Chloroflexaceae bacterium]